MPKPLVYVAHPLGGGEDREKNRKRAARWAAWAAEHMGVLPVAPWIHLAEVWDESKKDLGLAIDVDVVKRCDALWLVGGRISPGMKIEGEAALAAGILVYDLIQIGPEPPAGVPSVHERAIYKVESFHISAKREGMGFVAAAWPSFFESAWTDQKRRASVEIGG